MNLNLVAVQVVEKLLEFHGAFEFIHEQDRLPTVEVKTTGFIVGQQIYIFFPVLLAQFGVGVGFSCTAFPHMPDHAYVPFGWGLLPSQGEKLCPYIALITAVGEGEAVQNLGRGQALI